MTTGSSWTDVGTTTATTHSGISALTTLSLCSPGTRVRRLFAWTRGEVDDSRTQAQRCNCCCCRLLEATASVVGWSTHAWKIG